MPGFFLFNAATAVVELVDRAGRAGGSADNHRRERRYRISDHTGHDLRADPPAYAVRTPAALSRAMRHGRSMHRNAVQE
jgi:hypothetical protein